MDKRRNYVIVLDTETCNGIMQDDGSLCLDDSLVYDGGFSVVDTHGNVYEDHSYVIGDIFCGMKDLMGSAYYANKIPQYWDDLKAGTRDMISYRHFREIVLQKIKEYNVTAVVAHNARFDNNALNKTLRYLTKSKQSFFFPKDVELWDSLDMARSVLAKMPTYQDFCEENKYMTNNKTPKVRLTAEIIHRYMVKDTAYMECHTALEDVKIEREIMWYCYRQKKPMDKILYGKSKRHPSPFVEQPIDFGDTDCLDENDFNYVHSYFVNQYGEDAFEDNV